MRRLLPVFSAENNFLIVCKEKAISFLMVFLCSNAEKTENKADLKEITEFRDTVDKEKRE